MKINYDVIRTNSDHNDFKTLVVELDRYLAVVNGDLHDFFDQFNQIDSIKHVVIVYDGSTMVGIGAIKAYSPSALEIKRMFVTPAYRNKGVGSIILNELENWGKEMGCHQFILETGVFMEDAIALYRKNGYQVIPNYGQYEGVEDSICFQKVL